MKKTLKTIINTSLLMLFVSDSYGLVYNLGHVLTRTGVSYDPGLVILDNTTHPGQQFNGIDDTFEGSVTFNFTITFNTYPTGGSYGAFTIERGTNSIPIAIGKSWTSSNWNGFRGANAPIVLTFGANRVIEDQSQAFTMRIDYNAGAVDSGTLIMAGDSNVYDIGDYDYSFDSIRLRNGLSNTVTSFTGMSVEVIPEPATYALIFGALALVFVPLRRRFKA